MEAVRVGYHYRDTTFNFHNHGHLWTAHIHRYRNQRARYWYRNTDLHRIAPSFYDNFHWHIEVQHHGIDKQTQITATAFHVDDIVLLIDFYDDRIHTQCIRRVVTDIEPVVLLSMSAMMPKGLSFSVRTCS